MKTGVVLSLENRVAVVTGGSRGIGAAIVRMFTRAGARVVFNYQKAKAEAERLAQECGGRERCVAVQAELSTSQSCAALIDAAVQHFGKVDIVVGNHGVWPPQDVPVDKMTEEQW
jgi:3-oxoacyl-[acyl-carrier protein] reductase